jgi:hypothetical protein
MSETGEFTEQRRDLLAGWLSQAMSSWLRLQRILPLPTRQLVSRRTGA